MTSFVLSDIIIISQVKKNVNQSETNIVKFK
nr:MAG TPA: hypothetical protein [Caudoviricetes sp.]